MGYHVHLRYNVQHTCSTVYFSYGIEIQVNQTLLQVALPVAVYNIIFTCTCISSTCVMHEHIFGIFGEGLSINVITSTYM